MHFKHQSVLSLPKSSTVNAIVSYHDIVCLFQYCFALCSFWPSRDHWWAFRRSEHYWRSTWS